MKIITVIIFSILSFPVLAQEFTLQEFKPDGQDSLFKCKIIDRYDDFVRYVNNITDQDVDTDIKRHSYIAIFRLLASDGALQKNNKNFSILDKSLENKVIAYQRTTYLELLEKLSKFNYAYEKEFVTHGCTNFSIPTNNIVSTEDQKIKYGSPSLNYTFDFLEKSIRSDTIRSKLRSKDKDEGRINFNQYTYLKTLRGNLTKIINQEEYEPYKEEYLSILSQLKPLKDRDVRDTIRSQKKEELLIIKAELENEFTTLSLKFNSVIESEVKKVNDVINDLTESAKECNCTQRQPADRDNDGFPDIVDCSPEDPLVYPGAKINCANDCPDDNCDGVEDLCCVDQDGDGFYNSDGCGCNDDLFSLDKFAKCDCNDADPLVYPGADIDCTNKWSDDNCDGISDTLQIQRGKEIYLNISDYAYAPYGMTKFAKDRKFYAYTGLIAAGLTSTFYHRNRSQHYYTMHKNAFTLRTQNDLYNKANDLHHRYIISAYSTLTVFAVSMLDLKIQYSRYNKIRNDLDQKRRNCNEGFTLELDPLGFQYGYVGPKLLINF